MANFIDPYYDAGLLHNAGLDFVFNKLSQKAVESQVSIEDVIDYTAEFMYKIYCCNDDEDDQPVNFDRISKASYASFVIFLSKLHNTLQVKGWKKLASENQFSKQSMKRLRSLFSISGDLSLRSRKDQRTIQESSPQQMVSKLRKRILEDNIEEWERDALGIALSVAEKSMDYGGSLLNNKMRLDNIEKIERKVHSLKQPAPDVAMKKKIRWPWKADAEGALTGAISGSIAGIAGGVLVGTVLGGIGGAVSSSVVKKIKFFNK